MAITVTAKKSTSKKTAGPTKKQLIAALAVEVDDVFLCHAYVDRRVKHTGKPCTVITTNFNFKKTIQSVLMIGVLNLS